MSYSLALLAQIAPWLHISLLVRRRMCLCMVPAALHRDAPGLPRPALIDAEPPTNAENPQHCKHGPAASNAEDAEHAPHAADAQDAAN